MKTKRIAIITLCLFMCVIMGGEMILSAFFIPINAADSEVEYTNAYNDLVSNKSFDPNNYPSLSKTDPNYYSLDVITIAESENGELFVYVYQPSGQAEDVRAVSIDISTNERTEKQFVNYNLTYLNSYKQFYKYKVEDLTVSSDETRYYEISDILRPWSEKYGDKEPGGDNTISEVGYPVGKMFTFTGKSSMKVEDVEYIKITDQYVGYLRFEQDTPHLPFMDSSSNLDAHFVAFSTDRDIDELLEADVFFTTQSYYYASNDVSHDQEDECWGDLIRSYVYLDCTQQAIYEVSDGSVITSSQLVVDRIQRTSDFLNLKVPIFAFPGFSIKGNIDFEEDALLNLANTKWVLCFKETYHMYSFIPSGTGIGGVTTSAFSRVGDVKLMRLKFQTDGVIYNLGVVGNKQTGSENPAAIIEEQDWWQKIVALLLLIVLLFFLFNVCPVLFTLIKWFFKGIGLIIKTLWQLITFPFRIKETIKSKRQNSKIRKKKR